MFSSLLCCSSSTVSVPEGERPHNMLQYEEETNLLHGTLKVHVIEARDLPDTDSSFFHIARGDWTDPYVVVYLDKTELCKTKYLENNLNPVWDEIFSVNLVIVSIDDTFSLRLMSVTTPRVSASRSWIGSTSGRRRWGPSSSRQTTS